MAWNRVKWDSNNFMKPSADFSPFFHNYYNLYACRFSMSVTYLHDFRAQIFPGKKCLGTIFFARKLSRFYFGVGVFASALRGNIETLQTFSDSEKLLGNYLDSLKVS